MSMDGYFYPVFTGTEKDLFNEKNLSAEQNKEKPHVRFSQ